MSPEQYERVLAAALSYGDIRYGSYAVEFNGYSWQPMTGRVCPIGAFLVDETENVGDPANYGRICPVHTAAYQLGCKPEEIVEFASAFDGRPVRQNPWAEAGARMRKELGSESISV